MLTDIQIATATKPLQISQLAKQIGLKDNEYEPYGRGKAKVIPRLPGKNSKLILVTATSPTPYGEGKTTTSVGLADAIKRLNKKVCLALREPSLGPVFGIKGGAAGGGYSQLIPMIDLNLHFTGDFAAIAAANNLIAAVLDNSLFQGNPLRIDPDRILHKRAIDMNDRALRHINVAQGGSSNGVPHAGGFVITAACEIMAIFCLSSDLADLKERIGRMIVAFSIDDEPIYVRDLGCVDAVAILLFEALKPNLIQSLEHTPALVHGGPFANIAHGCNSLLATQTALGLADYVVSEAGFGSDLGAEKFIDIKCQISGLRPSCIVLVSTIRSIKFNGTNDNIELSNAGMNELIKGSVNLIGHIKNIQAFGVDPIVALNKFADDTNEEIDYIKNLCAEIGIKVAVCENYAKGSEGALDLARLVIDDCKVEKSIKFCYDFSDGILEKLKKVATRVYGASDIHLEPSAIKSLEQIEKIGLNNLAICVAKTQYSFSNDAKMLGCPKGFTLNVKDLILCNGAGFIVAVCGPIMLMPGLGKNPAALSMSISDDGLISGLS